MIHHKGMERNVRYGFIMAEESDNNLRDAVISQLMKACGSSNANNKKKRKSKEKEAKRAKLQEEDQSGDAQTSSPAQIERATSELKHFCKVHPDTAPKIAASALIKTHLVNSKTSNERLRAMNLADTLFQRSSKFRAKFCEKLRFVLDAVFGAEVPGPNPIELSNRSATIIRSWVKRFGDTYPQLMLGLSSVNIPLAEDVEEEDESSLNAAQIRMNEDLQVIERIKRAFRIRDGIALTGVGEDQATMLDTLDEKLIEILSGLQLLLPFLSQNLNYEHDDDDEQQSQSDTHSRVDTVDGEIIEWEDELNEEENPITSQFNSEAAPEEDEIVMDGQQLPFLPGDFTVTINTGQSMDTTNNDLDDVRQAVLDARLTCEREILPHMLSWNGSLERVLANEPRPEFAQLLIRVNAKIRELQEALATCDRMGLVSKHNPSSRNKLKHSRAAKHNRKPFANVKKKKHSVVKTNMS